MDREREGEDGRKVYRSSQIQAYVFYADCGAPHCASEVLTSAHHVHTYKNVRTHRFPSS